ncbi:MAG: hypothetical protein A2896_01870 [Candidatus Nealsonbacteria bacterium RIFCSPLOWO2_01_FULL_43_32]|uniref:Uncharacterized protein n=1 Tax=Candidatus Nealsonbacteria bacterium RIFCSPLOWO2_01_FULL_43_32 TaxID=1801672 RepID=A0A1G2EH27_9BACT|nr:MAG: hypothetical protein A2896_01870 [Candidatus Nealsonbacteria bacterium RIFCSPLOWO2_01_FULL_43_32]
MPSWNVSLRPSREEVIRVKKIINKKPDFIIVELSNGKQQKLCSANLSEWQQVEEGSKIELIVRESVVGAILLLEPFQKKVQEFLSHLQKEVSGLFFMWFCEHCKTMGHLTYEDGDEPWRIARHINAAHGKLVKPGCDKTKLKIYDHRGIPQRDSALLLSLTK